MSKEELRRLLVDAVPEAPAPTDRWNLVAGRVGRHRQRFAIAAATAVVAVLTVGTTAFQLFLPAPHHGPVVPPGGTASTSVSPSTAPEDRLRPAITAAPAQPPRVAFHPDRIPQGSPGSGPVPRAINSEQPT